MKIFSNSVENAKSLALKKCIYEKRQFFCENWAQTPNLFFSHVTNLADFEFVYQQIPELKTRFATYVAASINIILSWNLTADELLSLLAIVPEKLKFLAELSTMPAALKNIFMSNDAKSQLINTVLALDIGTKNSVKSRYFELFFADYIAVMPLRESEDFLAAIPNETVQTWLDKRLNAETAGGLQMPACFKNPKFILMWPFLVKRASAQFAQSLFKRCKMNVLNAEQLEAVCTPLFNANHELTFIEIYQQVTSSTDTELAKYFSKLLLIRLAKIDKASPELSELFARHYLLQNTFPKITWDQHVHYLRLFPEHFSTLMNLLLDEARFHSYYVQVPQLEKLMTQLNERGTVALAMILRKIPTFKVHPYVRTDLELLAVFAAKQVGPADAELAFCLIEEYWQVVRWNGGTTTEFLAKCSDDACNEYASQKDSTGLATLTRLLQRPSVDLFALLLKRLSLETLSIILHMNKPQLNEFFKKAGSTKLSEITDKVERKEFLMFLSFFRISYLFSKSNLLARNRFLEIFFDTKFALENTPSHLKFLQENSQEFFNAIMTVEGTNLLFLKRLQGSKKLQDCFAEQLKTMLLDTEIEERLLETQFMEMPITVGLLKSALKIWKNLSGIQVSPSWFSQNSKMAIIPNYIRDLQRFSLINCGENHLNRELFDEEQQLALKVILRDWNMDSQTYPPSIRAAAENTLRLLKSTSTFGSNTSKKVKSEQPLEYNQAPAILQAMRADLEASLLKRHVAYGDSQKVIEVIEHIVENMPKILTFFNNNYGRLYIAPHSIPIHTDHADRLDTNGYERALKEFVMNFLHAYRFAKSSNCLPDFFGKLYGGVCLEGRLDPCLNWASDQQEACIAVNLDQYMEKITKEFVAYSIYVDGCPEDAPKLSNPSDISHFALSRSRVVFCHKHELAPNQMITQQVIEDYCVKRLQMDVEPTPIGIMKVFSKHRS